MADAHPAIHGNKALNALDAKGVETLRSHLLSCSSGPYAGVSAVVLGSCTPRALCAGGDVKSARSAVLDAPYYDTPPEGHHIHRVFQAEYSTVVLVSELSEHMPIVALCDGVWMGLGFGIAGYCRHRVVTENTVFAMPENTIGLWPDVGFAWRAARLASPAVALFLGLTGYRVTSPSDLLWLGIGTHYCPSQTLKRVTEDLEANPADVEAVLTKHCHAEAAAVGAGPLQRMQGLLERCFGPLFCGRSSIGSSDSSSGSNDSSPVHEQQIEAWALQQLKAKLEEELAAYASGSGPVEGDYTREDASELLRAALDGLRKGSPGSLAITLYHYAATRSAAMAAAGHSWSGAARSSSDGFSGGESSGIAEATATGLATLRGVMRTEYCMAVRRVAQHDFLEGVRALLVDKDKSPRWRPESLATVDAEEARQLGLPLSGNIRGLDLSEVDAAVQAVAARQW